MGEIGKVTAFQSVCFVRVPPPGSNTVDTDPPDGAPEILAITPGICGEGTQRPAKSVDAAQSRVSAVGVNSSSSVSVSFSKATDLHPTQDLCQQLRRLGFLPGSEDEAELRKVLAQDYFTVESVFVARFNEFHVTFSRFTRQNFQSYLVNAATVLNNSHTRCLKMFILSAFDMARDMLITPKKLEFAREKEDELYKSLLSIAVSKIDEIRLIISETILDISEDLKDAASKYDFGPLGGCSYLSFCLSHTQLINISEHVFTQSQLIDILRHSMHPCGVAQLFLFLTFIISMLDTTHLGFFPISLIRCAV